MVCRDSANFIHQFGRTWCGVRIAHRLSESHTQVFADSTLQGKLLTLDRPWTLFVYAPSAQTNQPGGPSSPGCLRHQTVSTPPSRGLARMLAHQERSRIPPLLAVESRKDDAWPSERRRSRRSGPGRRGLSRCVKRSGAQGGGAGGAREPPEAEREGSLPWQGSGLC